MGSARILVLDDDDLLRTIVVERLERSGFEVLPASSIAQARARLAAEPDIALLDVKLPDGEGLELVPQLVESDIPVVMMTAHATVQLAVSALKLGANDFLEKPFNLDKLEATLHAALEITKMRREVKAMRQQFSASGIVVGGSPAMHEVLHLIEKIAPADATTVLLESETGTGKGVIARLIHQLSPRAKGPFVAVTCSSLAETLMESELFGHEKGAFTDARALKRGLFELADGGTLFLDEIGEMSLRLQSKLLQFLEDKTFRRVGGTRDLAVNTRVIAATNRDLEAEVAAGTFRADLYYRLRVVPVHIPPLRERKSDIEPLTKHFIESFNKEFGKRIRHVAPEASALLNEYLWPGNVRELRNVLERAVLLTEGDTLEAAALPLELRPRAASSKLPIEFGPNGLDLESLERALLDEALRRAEGSRSGAGRLLGLSRHQIRNRLKKFGVVSIIAPLLLAANIASAQRGPSVQQSRSSCDLCHGELEFLRQNTPTLVKARSMLVPDSSVAASAHAEMQCTECHERFGKFPHSKGYTASCASCHEKQDSAWQRGAHLKKPNSDGATCAQCHGVHHVIPAEAVKTKPGMKMLNSACIGCHQTERLHVDNPHADSTLCAGCHTAHETQRKDVRTSSLWPMRQIETCGACHDSIAKIWRDGDVHYRALSSGKQTRTEYRAPACTDCHGAHGLNVNADSLADGAALRRCGECHERELGTFRESYHGKATTLGSKASATCADCHGSHSILQKDSARSRVAQGNLIETCGECHEHARAAFVKYDSHPEPLNRGRNPWIFASFWFMNSLLAFVVVVFGTHTLLWWLRLYLDKKREAQ